MPAIKISADAREFKRSLIELSTTAKRSFGKSAISLFDADTKRLLSGQATEALSKLESRSARLKSLMAGYAKSAKEAAGDSRKEAESKQALLRTTQRLIAVERERAKLAESSKALRSGALGQMAGGLGEAAKDIPGLGKLLGISSMGALGLAAGGALIGGGIYGYSRFSRGYDMYKAGLPSRLALMGHGARDLSMNRELRQPFADTGMNEEDVRQARLQAMDALGAGGATQKSVLGRAQFSRNFGIDLQMLQGLGAGFRAQSSASGAQRDILKLQASLLASGIKDSIGPYLETAANMLTDIRQNGLVDSNQVLSLMASMTKTSGNSPEQTARHISGMQSAIQNSSGEANAFWQMVFARSGVGGETIGGTQEAIKSGGLFGVRPEDLKGMSPEHVRAFQRLGIVQSKDKNGVVHGGVKDRLGGFLRQIDQLFPEKTDEGVLAKGMFLNNTLHIGTSGSNATQIVDEMRRALKSGNIGDMQKAEKRLQDATKSPEEKSLDNLSSIKKSSEGQLNALEKIRDDQLEFMGKQAAPAALLASKTLLHIDEILSNVFGGISKAMGGDRDENAINGKAPISDDQVEELRQRGKMAVNQAGGRMVLQEDDIKKEIAREAAQRDRYAKMGDTTSANYYGGHVEELKKQLQTLNDNFNKLIGVQTNHLNVAKEHAETSKRVVKNQKAPKPGASSSGDKVVE